MKSEKKPANRNFLYIQKDAKLWVESPIAKTYSDEKEEPFFLVLNLFKIGCCSEL